MAATFSILMLIFCFVYFFELASFPFSLDEEWAALRRNPDVWIGQGRWGTFLIESFLLPQSAIPVVPHMIFGMACAGSFLLILRMLGRDILALDLSDYASFVIFCGFPTWFYIAEFASNIGAVGIGLFCGTLAIYTVAFWPRLFGFFAACLLGAFAIATYQTLLFYMFSLCVGVLIFRIVHRHSQSSMVLVASFTCLLIVSTSFYYLILQFFKWQYCVTEVYTQIFFNTKFFLDETYKALSKTMTELYYFYGFSEEFYKSAVWSFPILVICGFLSLLLASSLDGRRRIPLVFGAVALLLAPFALNPFYPVHVLGRTMVAVGVAVWFMTYLALSSDRRWLRIVSRAGLAVAIVQIVLLQNKLQASNYFLSKHDLLVATSIYDRLGNSPEFRKGVQYPMAVFGGRNFKSVYEVPYSSNANASFFGPFINSTQRDRAYMRMLGLEGLRPMTNDEMDRVIVRMSGMPIWPAAGSVIVENGNVLIRLSKEPGPTDAASLDRAQAKTN